MSIRLSLLNFYLRRFVRPALARVRTPQLARVHMEKSAARLPVSLRGIHLSCDSIAGPGGPVPVEWLSAGRADRRKVLIYLHGGAYIMGSPRTHRMITVALARRTGMRVLVPDFRLAPEHPVPAGLEDTVAVYSWLLAQGYEAANISLAGESSGGGQCFATLVALRQRGYPPPACIVAFSPWVDLTMSGASVRENARCEVMLPAERASEVVTYYTGDKDPLDPLISPLFDDGPVPPVLIQASKAEILRDDAVRMTAKLDKQGMDVTLELYDKVPHAWQFFAGLMPESDQALKCAVTFLKVHTGV